MCTNTLKLKFAPRAHVVVLQWLLDKISRKFSLTEDDEESCLLWSTLNSIFDHDAKHFEDGLFASNIHLSEVLLFTFEVKLLL